jgi:hypothetical protein
MALLESVIGVVAFIVVIFVVAFIWILVDVGLEKCCNKCWGIDNQEAVVIYVTTPGYV